MSYIYTQNRSSYYSDSDESFGGCPCVPCADPDPTYTDQIVEVFVPPPGNNPLENGFTYQLNSLNNYPTPANPNDLYVSAYDTLPAYPYLWFTGLNYGVSDSGGNVTYTIFFRIGTLGSPDYNFNTLYTDSINSNTKVVGPFTDLIWNGITVLPGQYWGMDIDLLDINDLPNLRVLIQMVQPGGCNPVRFGFQYEAQPPPIDPIAKYSESPTGIFVNSDDPRDSWAECDALLVGRTVQPSGTDNIPWYGTRRFNSTYWTSTKGLSAPPTQVRITISVSTVNRTYFTTWSSFTTAGGGLEPGSQGVTVNTGSRTPWTTNGDTTWPQLTFPYKDGPATEWPNSPHEQDFFIDFTWPLSMNNDQELEALYEYLDASNNVLVTHFQKDFIVREPLNKALLERRYVLQLSVSNRLRYFDKIYNRRQNAKQIWVLD